MLNPNNMLRSDDYISKKWLQVFLIELGPVQSTGHTAKSSVILFTQSIMVMADVESPYGWIVPFRGAVDEQDEGLSSDLVLIFQSTLAYDGHRRS